MANPRSDEAPAQLAVALIVDTHVPVDLLEDDPDWAQWSIGQLRAQAQVHELVINPIVYAELSLAFATVEALDAVADQMRLTAMLGAQEWRHATRCGLWVRPQAATRRRRYR